MSILELITNLPTTINRQYKWRSVLSYGERWKALSWNGPGWYHCRRSEHGTDWWPLDVPLPGAVEWVFVGNPALLGFPEPTTKSPLTLTHDLPEVLERAA